jgi:pimeloyl-ACP methyl ester carboxylesterase
MTGPPTEMAWDATTYSAYRLSPAADGNRTVLLLHGLGGNLEQLWGNVARSTCAQVTVFAADARLHGESTAEPNTPLSFDLLARDAFTLLRAIRPHNVYSVVGVSMGAGVALRLLHLFPAAFDRAVFLRPAWTHALYPPNLEILEEIGRLLNTRGAEEGKALFLQSSSYRSLHEASPATATSTVAQFDDPLAERRSRRLLEMPASSPYGSPEELGEISLPALVIAAPNDPVHPLATARTWAAGLRRAVYQEVTGRDIDAAAYRRDIVHLIDSFIGSSSPL